MSADKKYETTDEKFEKIRLEDAKNKTFERVLTCLRENLITREDARKIIVKEEFLPIRFEKDGNTDRWIGDVEVNHRGEMVAKEDFKKVEGNRDECDSRKESHKDDWMGDWINREVSNPKERQWEKKQCRAVIDAFNVQIELCMNKINNFERRLSSLEEMELKKG